jgi:hypothetical protein
LLLAHPITWKNIKAKKWTTHLNVTPTGFWILECFGEPVALLTEPECMDMFWCSYRLIPLTEDTEILTRLYSEEFWNEMEGFVWRERDSGKVAPHAFPSGGFELPTTGRVSMRGLYTPTATFGLRVVEWLRIASKRVRDW